MASTIWSFAAPADRETLTSSALAWLLDSGGTHSLGSVVLDDFARRAGLFPLPPGDLRIVPELSPSRDKRFDIAVMHGTQRHLIIEVKCKTFGSREQLRLYASSAKAVVRCGFSELNWPDLSPAERSEFKLVTLREMGSLILDNAQDGPGLHTTAAEFARHIIRESDFLVDLYGYFISCDQDTQPKRPTDFRYSQRFLNQLYWHWFIDRAKRDRSWFVDPKQKSEQSGVWLIPFGRTVDAGKTARLSKLDVQLPGPLEYWLHAELWNKTGLLANPGELVGYLQLRVNGDAEPGHRKSIIAAFADRGERLKVDGWRLASPRTRAQGYYSVVTRALTLSDFRFSHLIALMDSLVE